MEYPHWLIIAGAILRLVLGLVGLALRPRSVEAAPSDMTTIKSHPTRWPT
jgi:hypothetical protein